MSLYTCPKCDCLMNGPGFCSFCAPHWGQCEECGDVTDRKELETNKERTSIGIHVGDKICNKCLLTCSTVSYTKHKEKNEMAAHSCANRVTARR